MYGNHIGDAGTRGSSGVTGRSYGGDIAPYDCGYITATRFLVTDEFNLGSFDHSVGRFHHGRKTPAFNHS
jgi:hypothetical protein